MLDGFEEEGIEALKASNPRFAELCSQHAQLNKTTDEANRRLLAGIPQPKLPALKRRKRLIHTQAEQIAAAVMTRNTQPMNPVAITGHMSAFELRKAARKAAAENLTPEKMRTQLDNCEKQLKAGGLSPDLERSLTERIANLKAKLDDNDKQP